MKQKIGLASSIAARNSPTARDERCGSLATSLRFGPLSSKTHRRAGLDEARAKRRCRSIRYPLAANLASWVGACAWIAEPFRHLHRVTAHPQIFFWCLSCERPWALARDNTVCLYACCILSKLRYTKGELRSKINSVHNGFRHAQCKKKKKQLLQLCKMLYVFAKAAVSAIFSNCA